MLNNQTNSQTASHAINKLETEGLTFAFACSSGPGGQNVNKRATKVLMRVDMTIVTQIIGPAISQRLIKISPSAYIEASNELLIVCQSSRSQRRNKLECITRLQEMLLRAMIVPKKRKRKTVSRRAKAKRLDAKSKRSKVKRMRGEFD